MLMLKLSISIRPLLTFVIGIFQREHLKFLILKNLSRKIRAEFYRNRKSPKWRQMKKEWKAKKIVAVRQFHSKLVTDLKLTNPSKFYQMCKKIGTGDQMTDKELEVECLKGISDAECAEAVGQGFASVSSQFQPLDRTQLPAFLPSCLPCLRLRSKSTKCTTSC